MKNKKVVIYSSLALISLILTFFLHWGFIIPTVVLAIIGQKEIMKN